MKYIWNAKRIGAEFTKFLVDKLATREKKQLTVGLEKNPGLHTVFKPTLWCWSGQRLFIPQFHHSIEFE